MLRDSDAQVEALCDAEALADSDAHWLRRSLKRTCLRIRSHFVEAPTEADVLMDSLALVEALCDAEVLADSGSTC